MMLDMPRLSIARLNLNWNWGCNNPDVNEWWWWLGEYLKINSQSLEDTQVGYILQKYSLESYTSGKHTFRKYTYALRFTLYALRFTLYALRFALFSFHFTFHDQRRLQIGNPNVWPTDLPTYLRTCVGARDTWRLDLQVRVFTFHFSFIIYHFSLFT